MKIHSHFFLCLFTLLFYSCVTPEEKVLLDAANKGDIATVKKSLAQGVDIDAKPFWGLSRSSDDGDLRGCTPLMRAAYYGKLELVKYLISQGANVNEESRPSKYTALTIAAEQNQLSVARYLLSKGAEIDAMDTDRYTALHYAAENGYTEMSKLLVAHGANAKAYGGYGFISKTPADLARKNDHLALAAMLAGESYIEPSQNQQSIAQRTPPASSSHGYTSPSYAAGSNSRSASNSYNEYPKNMSEYRQSIAKLTSLCEHEIDLIKSQRSQLIQRIARGPQTHQSTTALFQGKNQADQLIYQRYSYYSTLKSQVTNNFLSVASASERAELSKESADTVIKLNLMMNAMEQSKREHAERLKEHQRRQLQRLDAPRYN